MHTLLKHYLTGQLTLPETLDYLGNNNGMMPIPTVSFAQDLINEYIRELNCIEYNDKFVIELWQERENMVVITITKVELSAMKKYLLFKEEK